MRRRWLAAAAVVATLVAGSLAAWTWSAWTGGGPPAPSTPDTMRVRIRPGMTLQAAADTLAQLGLLRHERVFLLGARLEGRDRDLRPGVFTVAVGAPPRDLLHALVDVAPLPVIVTVPEGLEAGQIAEITGAALAFPPDDFLAAADALVASLAPSYPLFEAPASIDRFQALMADSLRPDGRRLHWCEGYLAPDTYHFYEGTSAAAAAGAMVQLQIARLDSAASLREPGSASAALSVHDLLTLASIVESETHRDGERGKVAAVYLNRLGRSMRLEADPTVAFWLGKRGQRIMYSDLKVNGPFNTYLRAGLPPSPIGSPGWSALVAAAKPDFACDALFFVADGRGGHVFSRTHTQHQAAVETYRSTRRKADVDGRGASR